MRFVQTGSGFSLNFKIGRPAAQTPDRYNGGRSPKALNLSKYKNSQHILAHFYSYGE